MEQSLQDLAQPYRNEPPVPVPVAERWEVIDALRGAALFGILAANLRGFAVPAPVYFESLHHWSGTPDVAVQWLIEVLVMGKFITIFAVLFGLGFAIQLERARQRGYGLAAFRCRLLWLLVFGSAHALFLWWGDILIAYAVCGFVLPAFADTPTPRLMRWAWALYWLLPAVFVVFYLLSLAGVKIPGPPEPTAGQLAETVRIYRQGTLFEIFARRAHEWGALNGMFPLFATRIVGLFLFGVLLWRRGVFSRPDEHADWWRRAQGWGLALGLPLNAAAIALTWFFKPNPMVPSAAGAAMFVIASAGIPALSLFYAATLVRAWQSAAWRSRLRPFVSVGRMALTNYLLQSFLCTTIFYSYGGGFYGKGGPVVYFALTLLIYAVQVPFSQWWLSTRRWGPMERLWRRLTYGATRLEEPAA